MKEELDYLRRNTTNVKASTTKCTTFLNASSFKAKLSCFNGGDITTRATTDDDNIIFIGCRREVTREGRERKCIANRIGRVAKVSGNQGWFSSGNAGHGHCWKVGGNGRRKKNERKCVTVTPIGIWGVWQ